MRVARSKHDNLDSPADTAAAGSPADVTLTRLLLSVSLSVPTTLSSYAPADLLSLLPLATHALPFASVTAGSTPTVPVTLTTASLVPAAASANATTSIIAIPIAASLAAAAFLAPVAFAPAYREAREESDKVCRAWLVRSGVNRGALGWTGGAGHKAVSGTYVRMRWVIKCEAPGARGRGHKTTHKTDKVAPKLLCIYCLYYPRSSISSYRYN